MNIKYIETIIIVVSILLCHTTIIAQNDTIYYNQDWDETTRLNASFYRPMPLKKDGDKELIEDYYMNGTLQFEAWSKKVDNGSEYDGTVIWYYANGAKKTEQNYKNGQRNGADISYYENGAIEKEVQLIDDRRQSFKLYNQEGKLLRSLTYESGSPQEGIDECFTTYKDGRRIGEQLYYENTNILAYERICPDKGCYNESTETYYDSTGKVLQKNDCIDEEVIEGKKITFFEGDDCGHVKAIKTSTAIANGNFNGEYIRYDVNGKIIYTGTYKQHEPYEGTFETTEDWLTYVTVYEKGNKNGKEIVYNKEKKIAEGLYEDGVKQNGSFVEERQFTSWSKSPIILTLKEGKEEGQQKFYNVARDITMGFYHAKGGKKDGAYAVMDYDGEVLAEATYKDGKPFDGLVLYNDEYRFYKNGERVRENVVIDTVEQERMEAFSKGSDTIEAGYNLGGFETASYIAFLDTHQFFFSLSVGSLDLKTYGVYHLKNGTLKLQVPQEQKQDFVVYGKTDSTLIDSLQIQYYNYGAPNKPLLQLNKKWVALENLTQQEGANSSQNNETFKINLAELSSLKIGIRKQSDNGIVLNSVLEAETTSDYNSFIIAYNVSSREIKQFENATFTFNGENLVSDDKEKNKRPLTAVDKENMLDFIIENKAFPYTIQNGSYKKIKLNSKESHQKIKKYTQLIKTE